jgi:carbonic anhydrase
MLKKNVVGKIATILAVMALAMGVASAGFASGEAALSPDQALQKLMEGNKSYVENHMTASHRSDQATRASLAKSQKPYAVILSCSDSRVPPEIIFDKGLGEIFVIRVAGNIPDPVVLGSIEYAAEHLGSPLVMVLEHERCGAVTATVDAKGKKTGSPNIDALIKTIDPAVKSALKTCHGADKSKLVECSADINAKNVAASLTKNSKILKHLVAEKKLRIVVAKYDLDDGVVTLMK